MILPDWMAGFYTLLEEQRAPPLFAKWAAAYAIGAAAQRKVWLSHRGKLVYPNLYIFLCGPSGTGKGLALNPTIEVLSESSNQFIAPASLTGAALADELKDAQVSFISKGGNAFQYNPLTVISRELSVFLPAYDTTLLGILTDIFDNQGYTERRRSGPHKGRLEIPGAHLSLMAGTTPEYLNNILPEGAWGEGFMSRVVLVYQGPQELIEVTEESLSTNTTLREHLAADLTEINEREGLIRWERCALVAFNKWYLDGMKPVPTHPKLVTYQKRRDYNIWKLSLIFCLSRGGESITLDDFEIALDMLLETEDVMPDAFRAMRTGGDQLAFGEAWHYLFKKYAQNGGKPIARQYLVRFLKDRVPSHAVDRIIQLMVDGGMVKAEQVNKVGLCFIPLRPEED